MIDSPTYRLSDEYIERQAALDPGAATYLGIPGHDHEMTDFSPAGHEARSALDREILTRLGSIDSASPADRLAAGVLREALEVARLEYEAGEHLRGIRVIAGDTDAARAVFDLMPTSTIDDWNTIAERMSRVPDAFTGMRESWRLGLERGAVAQRRQVIAVAEQLETWAGDGESSGFFPRLAVTAAAVPGAPTDRLKTAARQASRALAETAEFLRREYAPGADPGDGVGPERHALARRRFMGMDVDAADAYAWGWEEVRRLDAEMSAVAQMIRPDASVAEVRHLLDTDPDRALHGEEALRGWLQELMDEAMSYLIAEGHFEIAEDIRRVEAMIAPPGGAAAMYYTGPAG